MTHISHSELPAIQARLAANRKTKVASVVSAPAASKAEVVAEKEMHRLFEQWCNLKGIMFVHFRMDKKAPTPGQFDFLLLRDGKCAAVEFKVLQNKLSEVQESYRTRLRRSGVPNLLASSVAEAIQWATEMLL